MPPGPGGGGQHVLEREWPSGQMIWDGQHRLAGGMMPETGVCPGQRVAAQKMSPRGGNNCKCQGKVKVSVALVCDGF